MSLDNLTNEAIRKSVKEANQSETLANKIIAWVTAISSGNETQDDAETAFHRAQLLYEDTEIGKEAEEQ